jgi:hypothetical protein
MKRISVSAVILTVLFCTLIVTLVGCKGSQPGETASEVRMRHLRRNRIEKEQFRQDVDTFFLRDEPSKLNDLRP